MMAQKYCMSTATEVNDLVYYDLDTNRTIKIDSGKILSGSFAPNNNLIAYIKIMA